MFPRPSVASMMGGLCALGLASSLHAQFYEPPALDVPGPEPETFSIPGDFNGDGLQDLAVGYRIYGPPLQQGIAVFLRTGPSSFAPPVLTPDVPGRWGQAVAVDVNIDGRTDLVLDVGVALLVSNGAGGFTTTYLGWAGYSWSGVAYADVNGDGHPDIVSTGKFFAELPILAVNLGDGQGGFGSTTLLAHLTLPEIGQIAGGDLDGDGDTDLVITRKYVPGGVGIFLNDGSAGFTMSSFVSTGQEAIALLLADLDGDSRLDAAVANDASNNLVILKGFGAGILGPISSQPSPSRPIGIVQADFDGDGHADLAVGGDGAWVYPGNGAAGYGTPGRYAARGGPAALDLNGDGLVDLAAGRLELFNLGAGALAAPRQFPAGSGVVALALGDMNGDGRADLVTANADSDDVAVLLGNPDASFALPLLAAAGTHPQFLALGDWNGDGRRDAAVANTVSRDVSILLGNGAGGLAPAGTLPFAAYDIQGLAAGDLNQDGRDDLVVTTRDPYPVYGSVWVLLAQGNGAFGSGGQYPLSSEPRGVALAALNPDVRLDALIPIYPSGPYAPWISTLLGDGAGAFTPPEEQPVFQALPRYWVSVGDLDGDGKLDAVAGGVLLQGDGQGGFTPFPDSPFELEYPTGAAIHDFDGNGSPDVALSNGDVHLGLGDGTGRFGLLNREFPIGGVAGPPVAGDFDGDGRTDLAVAVDDGSAVTVLRGEAMPPGADVFVSVTHTPDPAQSGGPLSITVAVTNQGPLAADAPTLTVQLPFGVTFVSSTPACQTSQPNPQMNTLLTCSLPDMAAGGTASVVVNVTVQAIEGVVLAFAVRAATDAPVDPAPLNNASVHNVPVGLAPDLAVTLSDSADPVAPGALFDYVIHVTNVGGSSVDPGAGAQVTGTLDSVTFIGANPPGYCSGGIYLWCSIPGLAPGAGFQIDVTVQAGTTTFIDNSVTVTTPLDTNATNDSATEQTQVDVGIRRELVHGKTLSESFPSGSSPAERLYYLSEQGHASYEVIVDAAAGDVAGAGQTLLLQRLGTDLSPVQDGQAAGTGPSRRLSFENVGTATPTEVVRVRSTGCGSSCGPGDSYRIRAYETTARIPRFNTTLTQNTFLVLENRTASPVQGHAWLWDEAGALVGTVPFDLAGHQTFVSSLASVAPGRKGTVTISHNGNYGALAGKGVALEPATGFTFDTALEYRPR